MATSLNERFTVLEKEICNPQSVIHVDGLLVSAYIHQEGTLSGTKTLNPCWFFSLCWSPCYHPPSPLYHVTCCIKESINL